MDVSSEEDFAKRIENWLSGIERDFDIGVEGLHDLDSYLMKEFDDLDSTVAQDPEAAYGRVVRIAAVCGHAARKRSHLVGILTKYIHRFVSVMSKLQKELGAISFSISVSFPFDISLSLNF